MVMDLVQLSTYQNLFIFVDLSNLNLTSLKIMELLKWV